MAAKPFAFGEHSEPVTQIDSRDRQTERHLFLPQEVVRHAVRAKQFPRKLQAKASVKQDA